MLVCAVLWVYVRRERCLPCERDVSRAARLAAGALRAVVALSLVAVDIARAVVVLLVVVLLLLLLLLLLTDLTVRDRRNGSESMRRVHGCKAAAWYKWSVQSRRMSSAERNDCRCGGGSESPRVLLVSRSSADHSLRYNNK